MNSVSPYHPNTSSEYLGDGVYVAWNGYEFEIRVNDPRLDPVVYLEVSVMNELFRFRNRVMKAKYGVEPIGDDE